MKLINTFNQAHMLSMWLSQNSKCSVIYNFNGKLGELEVKVYETNESKADNIYKVEKIFIKQESIVIKELENIITQLLILKNKYD